MNRVYLSSTSNDLTAYRNAVYKAIETFDGYHCMRMENFGARAAEPSEFCFSSVGECDIFVGIVGHNYGSCPVGSETSFSEGEYDAAINIGIPRLMFMAPDDFLEPAHLIESDDKRTKQRSFRTRVSRDIVRDSFTSPEDLATNVIRAIFNMKQTSASSESIVGSKTATKADQSDPLPVLMMESSEQDRASKDNIIKRIEFLPDFKPADIS